MHHTLQQNVDISLLSHFKTKAFTQYYFEITDETDIQKLSSISSFAQENNLEIVFIWWGSNILFAFDTFEGIVIKNNLKWFHYDTNTKILEVYSSEWTWEIAEILENHYGQNLWHRFIWLPWSIWGAVFWNAWCFWLEAESNFLEAEVYNFDTKKIEILDKNQSHFSYRNSIYKEMGKYFIIKIRFDLSYKNEKYHSDVDNIAFRNEIQPKWNSCGSFFKNPSKEYSAGKLLEEVGLKWFEYGSAYFSYKHANFLMTNTDYGNYKDLLNLIFLAKEKVKEKYEIELIPEVKIITNRKSI